MTIVYIVLGAIGTIMTYLIWNIRKLEKEREELLARQRKLRYKDMMEDLEKGLNSLEERKKAYYEKLNSYKSKYGINSNNQDDSRGSNN